MPNDTLRADARTMPKVKRLVGAPLPDDLAYLPDRYAMPVVGDCLAPEFRDGAILMFDKSETYKAGDLVNVFTRPVTADKPPGAMVMRLLLPPPPWVTALPYKDVLWSALTNALTSIFVQTLNPRKQELLRCADILAIHKCLGVAPPEYKLVQMRLPGARSAEVRL